MVAERLRIIAVHALLEHATYQLHLWTRKRGNRYK
jgi:hypothetical protein